MSGCTGRCNQGRDCTCFAGPTPGELLAWRTVIAAILAITAVAWGFAWATEAAARGCEAKGTFRAWGAVYECRAMAP